VERYLNGGNWRIIDEFNEVESGKRADRPELGKALAAARARRVPLVVANVDRLTRSVSFLSQLLDAGVDVRFADLPALEGATGKFMLQQMAAIAELEAGMISARTKAALAAAKKRFRPLLLLPGTPTLRSLYTGVTDFRPRSFATPRRSCFRSAKRRVSSKSSGSVSFRF
jgi:DNA invertase Pin-like site-specific DNA recombinase